jgi:multiple sugar transport system substrate-binding protein
MRSSKRFRGLLAAAAVAVVAGSTGCSAGSADSGGAVNLSLMIWDPAQTAGVRNAVDAFEVANPNVDVALEQVPQDQYYTKLDASLGAGEGPDVMWQSSRAPDYVDGGALQPLNEYIERDGVSLDAYPMELTGLYEFDGELYGMPKDQDAWTFVYNAAVFEKLGVEDVPTAEWTWADMVRIAEQVKSKQTSPADVPLYYDYQFNNGVSSLIRSLGGAVVVDGHASVSSPEGTRALEMVKDLQDRGLIPRIADSADFDAVSSLISGTVAIAEIPSWNLSLLSKADVPAGTFHAVRAPSVDGSWATDTNGLAYVMNANSAHKDEAWELIKFLTSDEGAVLHAEGGASPPANVSGDARTAFVNANDALVGLADALSATHEQSYLRTSTEYPVTRASLPEIDSTVMGPFYAGSLSASEAAAKIDEILDGALR